MNILANTRFDGTTALTMLGQSPLGSAESSDATAMITIKTRFGEIAVDTTKTILFPRGLLGMPDKPRYAISSFPGQKMAQFKLLQSLDDHNFLS